jgi:A/G-specific adenine glycosylase
LFTARFIAGELEGKFPQDYEQILKLKGVGSYTAAAIASFAFDLPHAVVDGNVHRVLARYFGIETSIDSSDGKKLFLTLANELLDKKNSAAYNQAIMDLGATVCKPQKSLCKACPLKEKCFAYEKEMTELLPVKSKKIKVKKRALRYYILKCNEYVYIQKRMAKDIWQNLYEPLLLEEESGVEEERLTTFHFKTKPKEIGASTQRLTHQLITAQFYFAELKKQEIINENGRWVIVSELENYAFPKTIVSFFKKIKLLLDD